MGNERRAVGGGSLAMLWRDTVAIGLLFGLVGAASTQCLCASPASRKKQARAKIKHERRRRRERLVMSQDSSGEDDSENEGRGSTKPPRLNARRVSPAVRRASPAALASSDSSGTEKPPLLKESGKQEMGDGQGQTTPVKVAGQLKMTALSPGAMQRERTLLEHVVSQKEAERGKNHPLTLMSKWNLADLLQSKYGDLEGACALASECVAVARRSPALGPEHPDTQRYETSRMEWEALRHKVIEGQLVFNGPWSPAKEQCWVPSTET